MPIKCHHFKFPIEQSIRQPKYLSTYLVVTICTLAILVYKKVK